MSFGSKLSIDHNIARSVHDDGEYKITITVERHGAQPITERDAELALTRTIPLMFNQRTTFGGQS